jgi:uncharacterized membrane protein (UPF0127 family)
MLKYIKLGLGACLLIASISIFAQFKQDPVLFERQTLSVNGQTLTVDYAKTAEQRARGLMHRKSMCEDCGMLFNFQRSRAVGMWMKNTLIPLDVAFMRANGEIVNIEAMQPHDLTTTHSKGAVLYAWEMNQGWFAKNKILVGDKVKIGQ